MRSTCNKRLGLRLGTINQIVEALVEQGEGETANQATIILKTAMICEDSGIEAAMEYYNGTHDGIEYQEFLTEVGAPVERVSPKIRSTGKRKEEE